MITRVIPDTFEALAKQLRWLREFLNKYELGSPQGSLDKELDHLFTVSIKCIDDAREVFASADDQSLHWKTQRLLKYLSRDLSDLRYRLDMLQIAAESFYASTADAWSTRSATVSTRSALQAAIEFAQQSIGILENRLFALARYYALTDSVEEGMREFDSEMENTVALYDKWRPEDIHEAAGADERPARLGTMGFLRGQEPPSPILCRLVPVMFATERQKVTDSNLLHVEFTNGRGEGMMTYGLAEVTIPRGHKKGRLERPVLWKLQFREDPKEHITIVTCEEKELAAWEAIAHERMKDAGTDAALVFIHGFNVSFDEAIRRTGQIGWDLNFHGLITAFSWCSEGEVLSYLTDVDNARLAVPRFIEFLRILRQEIGVSTINVIAHSMGNLVLIEALRKMAALQDGSYLIDEVVLAAPDFDADEFKAAIHEIKGKARRYTLYGSEKDLALVASKNIRNDYPRAGDGGQNIVIVEGIESIDATSVGEDLLGLGHSYFSSERTLLNDLYYVIQESLPPWRRADLDEVRRGSLRYWVFQQ